MPEPVEVQYFTLAEVAKNNGRDCKKVWIIYKDNVYDVTDYLEEHPGGGELITEWAGMDCTKEFDKAGHSGDAKKDLKKYKIGEIIEIERKKQRKGDKANIEKVNSEKVHDPHQKSVINSEYGVGHSIISTAESSSRTDRRIRVVPWENLSGEIIPTSNEVASVS